MALDPQREEYLRISEDVANIINDVALTLRDVVMDVVTMLVERRRSIENLCRFDLKVFGNGIVSF